MAHAVSLAVVPNIALNQTRTGTLSMWKGMAGPQGARAGVNAAAMMEAERFKDADVLALMGKCKIELPDEFSALAPETRCCRITATLKDGRTVVAELRRSLADDAADTGWRQSVDKFTQLTEKLLTPHVRTEVIQKTEVLENIPSLAEWIALTQL